MAEKLGLWWKVRPVTEMVEWPGTSTAIAGTSFDVGGARGARRQDYPVESGVWGVLANDIRRDLVDISP